jgi:hypothetical protein
VRETSKGGCGNDFNVCDISAGTIGAVGNNGVGVSGVSWRVHIIGCKHTSMGFGSFADSIQCIRWCR